MTGDRNSAQNLSLRVLFVSDESEDDRRMMQDIRRMLPDAQVRHVSSAKTLRAAGGSDRFDIALVDAGLTWTAGSTVVRTLKARAPDSIALMIWEAGADDSAGEAIPSDLDGFVLRSQGRLLQLRQVVALALRRGQTQRAKREAEMHYRSLFDNVPVGIYRTAPDGQILDVNHTLVRMLGYPDREALLAVNAVELYAHPEDRERWQALLAQGDASRGYQVEFRRRDGSVVWMENSTRLARDEQQRVLYYEGTLRDITQRKRAERALHASEERFRTIIDQSPVSIQVMTPDGWTVQVNQAWEKLWGITAADVRHYNMLRDEQAGSLSMMPYLRRGFAGEAVVIPPVAYHTPETLKTGRKRWFQARIYPVLDERGEIRNVIMMYEDITERQWATEDLQRLSVELMNSQESERKRISQDLHDELGQALTAIRINLAALERDLGTTLSPPDGERLREANSLVDQMLEHVRDLSHDLRPPMLDELGLVPTLRWYAYRQVKRLGIEVEFEVIALEERLAVEVETVLYRVVQEAFTNIARHASARRVKLRLARNHARVTLSIEDDGIGFDLQKRASDLSPGAGLAGMRERVVRAGGTLAVFSRPGQGTRLSIDLPLADASARGDGS